MDCTYLLNQLRTLIKHFSALLNLLLNIMLLFLSKTTKRERNH